MFFPGIMEVYVPSLGELVQMVWSPIDNKHAHIFHSRQQKIVIIPTSYENLACLRLEIYGCPSNDTKPSSTEVTADSLAVRETLIFSSFAEINIQLRTIILAQAIRSLIKLICQL